MTGKQPPPSPWAEGSSPPPSLTGPTMKLIRSPTAASLADVVISDFDDGMLGLAPIATAAGPLKDLLAEALAKALHFKLKVSITWEVAAPTDIEQRHDYHMNFTPSRITPSIGTLGGGRLPPITGLLQSVRQRAQDKIEFVKTRASALVFERIKEMRFSLIPHTRELALAERPVADFPELDAGGCTVKLPTALINKRCCLNITNKDSYCFRYSLIAWAKGAGQEKNAERPTHYLLNAPGTRGALPKNFVPEFDDA
eukprot:2492946-Alexandrium_andersonii.AAC.1